MASKLPELIFLSGPDGGRTIVLDAFPVTMGRSSSCAIRLSDQYASREQASLHLSPDGVIVECLSSRGTQIGEKSYKAGKRLILATGDVMRIGTETEILFLAAGDDRDEALAAIQARREAELAEKRKAAEAAEAAVAEIPKPEKPRKPKRRRKDKGLPSGPPAEQPAPLDEQAPSLARSQEAIDDEHKQKRRKKIYTFVGIWLGLMVALFVLLIVYAPRSSKTNSSGGAIKTLTKDQIRAMLQEVKLDERYISDTRSRQALDAARDWYRKRNRGEHPGAAFSCIEQYNLARAYAGIPDGWMGRDINATDMAQYNQTLDELTETVFRYYDSACAAEAKQRWTAAKEYFQKVLDRVPDGRNPVYRDVLGHLTDIEEFSKKKSRGGGSSIF